MTLELWKGGWYIVDGSDPVELKLGPFVTFLEAYTILNQLNLERKGSS